MKITVFGSTGGVGKELVRQALDSGWYVVAYARNPSKLTIKNERLTVVQGQLEDAEAIEHAVRGADAVISALGPGVIVKGTQLSSGTKNILSAMKKFDIRRFIAIGTASVTDPNDLPDFKFKLIVTIIKTIVHDAYAEIIRMADAVRSTDLDWTLVRVPLLNNKPKSDRLKIGYYGRGIIRTQLSRADLVAFMLEQIEDTQYIRKAPAISN
jgi:putative NADH-flavin reductase